jgi:hypothetical protein
MDSNRQSHDVFISYAAADTIAATAVRSRLESRGITCWMSRPTESATATAESIRTARDSARVMVVVFSTSANTWPQVASDVEYAIQRKLPIVPLRLTASMPTGPLESLFGNAYWIDAITPPLAQHLSHLTSAVRTVLGEQQPRKSTRPALPPRSLPPTTFAASERASRPLPARVRTNTTEGAPAEAQVLSHRIHDRLAPIRRLSYWQKLSLSAALLSLLIILLIETPAVLAEARYLLADPLAQKLMVGSWKLSDMKQPPSPQGIASLRLFTRDANLWTFFSNHTMEQAVWNEAEQRFERTIFLSADVSRFRWTLAGNHLRLTPEAYYKHPTDLHSTTLTDREYRSGAKEGDFELKDGSGPTIAVSRHEPYFEAILSPVPRQEGHPTSRLESYLVGLASLVFTPLLGAAWSHRRKSSSRLGAIVRAVMVMSAVAAVIGAALGFTFHEESSAFAFTRSADTIIAGIGVTLLNLPLAILIGFLHPLAGRDRQSEAVP